jgi:glycine/D-amino acid oxidase-like deaminating enzyme
MELHSGLPYWIVKNELFNHFNPLKTNIQTKVAIIGSGITGSLVAHELCKQNIACVIIDKRSIGLGSSAASTSQLQYEIDEPLTNLIELVGEDHAVRAYKDCLNSITDIREVLKETKTDGSYKQIPTFLLASNQRGVRLLEKEYEVRKKNDLPIQFLNKQQLAKKLGVDNEAALYNDSSAQIDCYQCATGILNHYLKNKKLEIYSHTLIENYRKQKDGYILTTTEGYTVTCEYVVVAAGFEAGDFLPQKVMTLLSTYAIISQPVDPKLLWHKRALIWETKDPYIYMRTTDDNRIIVGGEDIPYSSPDIRDDKLRIKSKALERKFKKMFPEIPFVTEMSWCGTFSATADGLPFIGAWPRHPRMLFTLGYGGNGITFSMIGAQVISNIVRGIHDPRLEVYGFKRLKNKKDC